MSITLLSATLGSKEREREYVDQEIDGLNIARYNDSNFPLRPSMTTIMQAKIPKILGWEMRPGYDCYVWVDGSFSIPRHDSVKWLLSMMGDNDMVFFRHPQRELVCEEMQYLNEQIKKGNPYIVSRYRGEMYNDEWFVGSPRLLAAGVFAYKGGVKRVEGAMKEWYHQVSVHHVNDQLSLPYVLNKFECRYSIIENDNILHNGYFKHHWKKS